jgi:non-ribosomal peptide synthetase component F
MILFNIQHSAFDGASESMFLRNFCLAYESNCSGVASTTQISFNSDVSTSFLNYASSQHLSLFQLGLASFYAFLFKLTHGQNDLCIACINANRYRSELQNLIGMFVSTLPYRTQLDPHSSFDELVKHVRDNCLSILGYSHYPLQHILGDFQLNQSNVPFLETVFDFITVSSEIDELSLNGINLKEMSVEESYDVAKFDFTLTFICNPMLDDDRLSCSFVCSRDLYEEKTVANIARRFEYLFEQLFTPEVMVNHMEQCIILISKLSVILPEEAEEMQGVIFCRQANIIERGLLIFI